MARTICVTSDSSGLPMLRLLSVFSGQQYHRDARDAAEAAPVPGDNPEPVRGGSRRNQQVVSTHGDTFVSELRPKNRMHASSHQIKWQDREPK